MEIDVYLRFIAALAVTLGLIGLVWWGARRWAHVLPIRQMGGDRRLAVVEVGAIDARRRLVLVRRDDTEHLLLLGTQNDLVVESGIRPPRGATPPGATSQGATPQATGVTAHLTGKDDA